MTKKIKIIISSLLLIFIIIFSSVFVYFNSPPISNFKNHKEITFKISKGESLARVSRQLENENLIKFDLFFKYLAILLNASGKIKQGYYLLSSDMSNLDILEMFILGKVKTITITIKEGYDIFDIDNLLLSLKVINKKFDFVKLVRSKKYRKNIQNIYNIKKVYSLEGFLFPDTYVIKKGDSPEILINMCLDNFDKKVGKIFIKAKKTKLMFKILKIASMIEKESAIESEKSLISSVIYNRLKKHMKLQIDPTLLYAKRLSGDFSNNIRYKDLYGNTRINSKYNTYYWKGLPPGPICNPGITSIIAALYPEKTKYLFFVAYKDKKKGHVFTKTYPKHLKFVKKYQR